MINIICLHGLGCSTASFHDFAENFSRSSNTLLKISLVSLPNRLSSQNDEMDFSEFSVLLSASVKKTEDVAIIAHSMGSAIAIPLAKKLRARLRALVLIEGNLLPDDCGTLSRTISECPDGEYPTDFNKKLKALKGVGWEQWRKDVSYYDKNILAKYASNLVKVSSTGNLLSDFLDLQCPKMLIFGDDYMKTKKQPRREVLDRIPRKNLSYVKGSSHFVMQDQPRKCAKILQSLLDQYYNLQ